MSNALFGDGFVDATGFDTDMCTEHRRESLFLQVDLHSVVEVPVKDPARSVLQRDVLGV
jgi:hypothetical protein